MVKSLVLRFQPCTAKVQLMLENVDCLDHGAFDPDRSLQKELAEQDGHPLGIVLVSANTICKLCKGELQIRSDRPSYPKIYSDDVGTVNGTHFRKYAKIVGKDAPSPSTMASTCLETIRK